MQRIELVVKGTHFVFQGEVHERNDQYPLMTKDRQRAYKNSVAVLMMIKASSPINQSATTDNAGPSGPSENDIQEDIATITMKSMTNAINYIFTLACYDKNEIYQYAIKKFREI